MVRNGDPRTVPRRRLNLGGALVLVLILVCFVGNLVGVLGENMAGGSNPSPT